MTDASKFFLEPRRWEVSLSRPQPQPYKKKLISSHKNPDVDVWENPIVQKLREGYKKHEDIKKNRCIQVIDNTKPVPIMVENSSSSSSGLCQANTKSGKKCTFRASCGKFCKKHNLC
uniref:Uncharacterized protein n=1 Tax=viral metagenome TaxID=1070528 RepID=A0A6C0JTZ6_9ZZZZ